MKEVIVNEADLSKYKRLLREVRAKLQEVLVAKDHKAAPRTPDSSIHSPGSIETMVSSIHEMRLEKEGLLMLFDGAQREANELFGKVLYLEDKVTELQDINVAQLAKLAKSEEHELSNFREMAAVQRENREIKEVLEQMHERQDATDPPPSPSPSRDLTPSFQAFPRMLENMGNRGGEAREAAYKETISEMQGRLANMNATTNAYKSLRQKIWRATKKVQSLY